MDDKEKLKTMAAPNSERIAIAVEALLEVSRDNLKVNEAILEEKKANHSAWLDATDRRFYVSLVTVVLMVSAFYAEKDNAFINGMVEWWEALKVIL